MDGRIRQVHLVNSDGTPRSGLAQGEGFVIKWRTDSFGNTPNNFVGDDGATVESVLTAAKGRLEFLQDGKGNSPNHSRALGLLEEALSCLSGNGK